MDAPNKLDLTQEETFWVTWMRYLASEKKTEITRKWALGRLAFTFNWRSRKSLMGRFGGGWQWELGFQAGGRTVIFNLLIFSLRIYWAKKETNPAA